MSATLTAGDALFQAILDDPADDGLRLVYADFLEENGEADRAEFIQAQCELATGKPCLSESVSARCHCQPECRRCALRRCERELLEAHGREWSEPLAALLCGTHDGTIHPSHHGYEGCADGGRWKWSRGFVWSVSLPCADWLRHGPRLVRSQPLERVRLTDAGPTRYATQRLIGEPGPFWRWFEDPGSDPGPHSSELPSRLWNEYAWLTLKHGASWEHTTEEEAWDWLSRACLSWARRQEPS